jgi:hypothetical protein
MEKPPGKINIYLKNEGQTGPLRVGTCGRGKYKQRG